MKTNVLFRSFARILFTFATFFFFCTVVEKIAPRVLYNVGFDTLEYWSAATIFLKGLNPYDRNLVFNLQQLAWNGDPISNPIILYNPPMILSIIFPMGLMQFKSTLSLWLSIMFAFAFESCVLCRGLFNSRSKNNRAENLKLTLFFLTFFPFYCSLFFGQISPLLLLSLTLALVCFMRGSKNLVDNFLGGLVLSVTCLKPHLLYLLYLYIFIMSIRVKKWKTLAGMLLGVSILLALPILYNPKIIWYFMYSAKSPPTFFKTPTLGSFLQGITQDKNVIVRYTPTIILSGFTFLFLLFSKRNAHSLTVVYYLIPLSLLTAPYGWVYDQMLCVPVIFFIFSKLHEAALKSSLRRYIIGALLVFANISGMLIYGKIGQHNYLWYPFVILIALSSISRQYETTMNKLTT